MKYRNYIILAVVLVAAYFLFFREEDADDYMGPGSTEDDGPVGTLLGDPIPNKGDSMASADPMPVLRRRVSSPGIGHRPIGHAPIGGRWYGRHGRRAAIDAAHSTGCTYVESSENYGCFFD